MNRSFPPLVLAAAALISSPALGQDPFKLPRYISDSYGGEVRAHGDFDNDGDADMLHTSNWLDWLGMQVLFNDGQGFFTRGIEHDFEKLGGEEVARFEPALADFDGDGFLDVAIDWKSSIEANEGVEVWFGDGTGDFVRHRFPTGEPRTLLAGQIDADPQAELFVDYFDTGFDRWGIWLDWNGSTFVSTTPLPLGHGGDPENGVSKPVAGDWDLDGDTDVASMTADHTVLRILETVGGAPTYGQTWAVPVEFQNINHSLGSGDLDGDGDLDLLHMKYLSTADPLGPKIQIYDNDGLGNLAPQPWSDAPTPTFLWFSPHDMRLGDWDGDGWLDLLSNRQDLDVLRANGDGTFSEGFNNTLTNGQAPGGGPVDVNGDGKLDYVATRTVVIGDQSWTPDTGLGSFGNSILSSFDGDVRIEDVDGDGDLDVWGGPSSLYAGNDGTGLLSWVSSSFEIPPGGASYGGAIAHADFDGDGDRDLVLSLWLVTGPFQGQFLDMRLLANDGANNYSNAGVAMVPGVQVLPPLSPDTGMWDTGDIDDDGDLDILVDNGYWENNGSGYFQNFIPAYSGRAREVVDFDGDGDLDLVGTEQVGNDYDIVFMRNDGLGGYDVSVLGTQDNDEFELAVVDLDFDGDPDIWSGSNQYDGVLVWENQGGAVVPAPSLPIRGLSLRHPAFEDIDEDGQPELLAYMLVTEGFAGGIGLMTVFEFEGPGPVFSPVFKIGRQWACGGAMALFDGDGDGDIDGHGWLTSRNDRVAGTDGGAVRQYGTGFVGSDGIEPILGAAGPITSTNPQAEIRLVQGLGGSFVYFALGLAEDQLIDNPVQGMTLLVGGASQIPPLPLGGAPGVPGQGTLSVPLPSLPSLAGISFFAQAFVVDAGSTTNLSASNGLEFTFGL